MWLLNAETECLEQVPNEKPGLDDKSYAILSHRWLPSNEQEVSFNDVRSNAAVKVERSKLWPFRRRSKPPYKGKIGYRKVQLCCQQAQQQGLKYVWIDTCCINKSDESETAEAIRSMYNWYRRANICYVYLADVTAERLSPSGKQTTRDDSRSDWRIQFEGSSWFRRGWTLQELLAPRVVNFYNANWKYLGTLEDLVYAIAEVTRIARSCLTRYVDYSGRSLSDYSYAQRLSWAARRETTRGEDRTYSLMGVFGVHMPVLYSEGSKQAFRRLQDELFRRSADQSLLAWSGPNGGLLSPSIDYFRNSDTITAIGSTTRSSDCVLDDKQYRTFLPILPLKSLSNHVASDLQTSIGATHIALLNCRYTNDPAHGPALCLHQLSRRERNGDLRFHVIGETQRIQRCPLEWFRAVGPRHISIVRGSEKRSKGMQVRLKSQVQGCQLFVDSWYPEDGWSHAANDGHGHNAMYYAFWPRAPGTRWHTAAVVLEVDAGSETFYAALVLKYNKQGNDAKIVRLALCPDTSLEELCRELDSHVPSPASSPSMELALGRSCWLQAFSYHGKVTVALVGR